jgi:pimeloyl-ACP methyl ester carboxylesterase
MKASLNLALVVSAVVAAAACVVGYGAQVEYDSGQATETAIAAHAHRSSEARQGSKGRYAEVNGLKMYYEIHGSGQPLVLLHGAFGFVEGWGAILPKLTKTHQVIAIELQGHGHTNDLDRPLTYEQMAEDTAALLNQLKIKNADFFGYSMGGTVALRVAIRHPELVRKLAIYGSCAGKPQDVYDPESYKQYQSISGDFAPPVLKEPYDRTAPDPKRWPVLVTKVKELGRDFKGYSAAELKAIKAHPLVMMGDRDVVRPEHAVEMYRQIPNAQLAIFPGGDHFMLFSSPDKLLSTLLPFLNAPIPEPKKTEDE